MAQQRKRTTTKSQTKQRSRAGQSRKTASKTRAAGAKSRSGGSGRANAKRSRASTRQQQAAGTAQDAIAVLRADHVRVRALLEDLQQATTESRRTSLLDQLEAALKEHTSIEEQVFYPAFREAAKTDKDRRLFHEATEEHHVVDVVLPEVRASRHEADVFAARAKVLRELVQHHIDEEQDDMFPRARQLFTAAELRDLGAQLKDRKRTEQRPAGTLEKVGQMIGLTS